MTVNTCDLKVVLLCKGKGGDPNTFQPQRDESQWFCRRDALVRCIVSFLLGPTHKRCGTKELIMVFDDDFSRMHMVLSEDFIFNDNVVPNEQSCLKILKAAARTPNKMIASKDIGLKCILYIDPTISRENISTEPNTEDKFPLGLQSKRLVLEYLQKHCSIDFLRSNGLNSKIDVILRKTNQEQLLSILASWSKETSNSSPQSDIGKIFSDVLKGKDNIITPTISKKIIAGILHETCEEFPCYGLDDEKNHGNLLIYLFLGAVRDMSDDENRILTKICQDEDIQTVSIRFGRVPEFTSKILSILAFHHAQCKLGHSLLRLSSSLKRTTDNFLTAKQNHVCLHVVATVPLRSDSVSSKLSDRDFVHWALVRFVVCTLWRSKLVSSNSTVKHTNTLHLLFDDGVFVSLQESDFVTWLAEIHHAAPSEFQILHALNLFIQKSKIIFAEKSRRRTYGRVLDRIQCISDVPISTAIVIGGSAYESLTNLFYSSAKSVWDHQGIVFFKPILPISTEMNRKFMKSILSAAERRGIKTLISSSIVKTSIDVAAEITCIQHFCYQERLFLTDMKRKAEFLKNGQTNKKKLKNDG